MLASDKLPNLWKLGSLSKGEGGEKTKEKRGRQGRQEITSRLVICGIILMGTENRARTTELVQGRRRENHEQMTTGRLTVKNERSYRCVASAGCLSVLLMDIRAQRNLAENGKDRSKKAQAGGKFVLSPEITGNRMGKKRGS